MIHIKANKMYKVLLYRYTLYIKMYGNAFQLTSVRDEHMVSI